MYGLPSLPIGQWYLAWCCTNLVLLPCSSVSRTYLPSYNRTHNLLKEGSYNAEDNTKHTIATKKSDTSVGESCAWMPSSYP